MVLPVLIGVAGVGAIVVWVSARPTVPLEARLPGLDRPAGVAAPESEGPVQGTLATFAGTPDKLTTPWPQFRGPKGDNIVRDQIKLARKWPSGGPRKLWQIELGEGYAGAAVWNGRVYVVDYDRDASADAIRCFSLADGKEIWRFSYPVVVKRNHGMSRTVPAITDKYLVAMGPKLHVSCLDPATGKSFWQMDLKQKFRSTVPQWYTGQCPIIENDRVILAPGDDALVAAVDCKSGQVLWKSANPSGWKMTHASLAPMEFGGRRMYVYCASGGVAGVDANDGHLLWQTTDWKITMATVPSPVVLPGGRIFFCGGYNSGSLLLELKREGERLAPVTVARFKPAVFSSTQHTPILYENHLYGVREKDREFVCLSLAGKPVWSSGSEHRFDKGMGPYLLADKMFYVLDDSGKLTLLEATPTAYKQLAEAQILDGADAWAPMALVGGRLLLRDMTRMVCIDVANP